MAATADILISPARRVSGRLSVPGDKSISHRALIFSALADGTSRVTNLGPGDDCRSTRACLTALGVSIHDDDDGGVVIAGRGLGGLRAPSKDLDAGNSGTTTRLLLGVLAGHPWAARVTGDASLSRRPMRRIIDPLERMGARITSDEGRLPVQITGGGLRAVTYSTPVASAQVKSGILLAALHADGLSTVREPAPTRDHTERGLRLRGVTIDTPAPGLICLAGRQRLQPLDMHVPGDPSSAAFWAVAAAAMPDSDVTIERVCLNPTRVGFLAVLRRAGADVTVLVDDDGPEPTGSIRVRGRGIGDIVIDPGEVPGVIDELPALAALSTFGGSLSVSGAGELRVKESDRIADLARGLRALGAHVEERPDGFTIDGRQRLAGGHADAAGDHRLAMAFALAALGAGHPSRISGADAVSVSYPGFFPALEGLRA